MIEGWVSDIDKLLQIHTQETLTCYGIRRSCKTSVCENKGIVTIINFVFYTEPGNSLVGRRRPLGQESSLSTVLFYCWNSNNSTSSNSTSSNQIAVSQGD